MSIHLYALSTEGEFLAVPIADVASAGLLGDSMVDTGAWRTWDAFDVSIPRTSGPKLVASYTEVRKQGCEDASGAAMSLLSLSS
jgi:hypothetical protein